MKIQNITKNDKDYTLFVFGPYSDGFDIEIHEGTVSDNDTDAYLTTLSGVPLVDVDSIIDTVLV